MPGAHAAHHRHYAVAHSAQGARQHVRNQMLAKKKGEEGTVKPLVELSRPWKQACDGPASQREKTDERLMAREQRHFRGTHSFLTDKDRRGGWLLRDARVLRGRKRETGTKRTFMTLPNYGDQWRNMQLVNSVLKSAHDEHLGEVEKAREERGKQLRKDYKDFTAAELWRRMRVAKRRAGFRYRVPKAGPSGRRSSATTSEE